MHGCGIDELLFVSNMGDDSISVIDIIRLRELKRISLLTSSVRHRKVGSVGKRPVMCPHSIRMDKNKNNIYTVNSFDNSISVIDIKSLALKESFFAGIHPNDIAFNGDESLAYVTNGDSDSVSVIDMQNREITAQVPVGVMPHGLCASPNGEYIYTANMDSGSVSVIDTWSNSKVFCIKVGQCPIDVLTSQDGRYIYVACSFLGCDRNGVISVVSAKNYKIIKNIDVGMIPVQIGLSADGSYLYVTNMGSNALYAVDLSRFEVINKINTGKMARGISIDGTNRIFVSNSEDNNVAIIDTKMWSIVGNIEVGSEPTSMLYLNKSN